MLYLSSSFSSDTSMRRCVEGQAAALLHVSSPSTPSVLTDNGSNTPSPGRAVESLFRDSNIQDIVDRYTRELNVSLRATGRTTGAWPHELMIIIIILYYISIILFVVLFILLITYAITNHFFSSVD